MFFKAVLSIVLYICSLLRLLGYKIRVQRTEINLSFSDFQYSRQRKLNKAIVTVFKAQLTHFYTGQIYIKNILKVDRFRQFSKPYVGSTMLFSRTKPPRKVQSVSEDSFGYLVLRNVSFTSTSCSRFAAKKV